MRDLDHALRLIEATVSAVSVPVTVKMRLGWDDRSLNAPELARRAEAAGVRMLTVHGRTRCQFYKGQADWRAIRAVVEAVSIPVVANGDCAGVDDARAMLAVSGAAGVMVGRAALGRPWLVGEIAAGLAGRPLAPWRREDRLDALLEHHEDLMQAYGTRPGLRHARKHLAAAVDHLAGEGVPVPPQARLALVTSDEPTVVRRTLTEIFALEPRCEAA
jgi:nifR3 family TIM-barrel protein